MPTQTHRWDVHKILVATSLLLCSHPKDVTAAAILACTLHCNVHACQAFAMCRFALLHASLQELPTHFAHLIGTRRYNLPASPPVLPSLQGSSSSFPAPRSSSCTCGVDVAIIPLLQFQAWPLHVRDEHDNGYNNLVYANCFAVWVSYHLQVTWQMPSLTPWKMQSLHRIAECLA